jgi:hypothetical protein
MKKGDLLEAEWSGTYHNNKNCVPALISSLVLRSHNLGQVDVAYLEKNKENKWVIKIIETKFSQFPSGFQMKRLRGAQDYISRVLDVESKLEVKFCQKADPSLSF